MDNHILGAYASIFELSVALNFAYASSKQFQDTIKSGFLQNIQYMETKYRYYQEKLDNDLNMIDETLVNEEEKSKLKKKYKTTLENIHNEGKILGDKLIDTQDIISSRVKSTYVFVAIFSLFILFIAGQEVKHDYFPVETMSLIVALSVFSLICFYILSFTKFALGSVGVSFILFMAILISLYLPDFSPWKMDFFKEEASINLALIISFSPFIISITRLFVATAWLEIQHRNKYSSVVKEIAQLNYSITNMSESRSFINTLG